MVKKDVHDDLQEFFNKQLKTKLKLPKMPVHDRRTDKFDIDQSFSGSQKETKNKETIDTNKKSTRRGREQSRSKSAKSRTAKRVEIPKMSESKTKHKRNKSSLTNIQIKKGGLTGKNSKKVAVTNTAGDGKRLFNDESGRNLSELILNESEVQPGPFINAMGGSLTDNEGEESSIY